MSTQEEDRHRNLMFWERNLTPARPCRQCSKAMLAWHDALGAHWEMCRTCDIG